MSNPVRGRRRSRRALLCGVGTGLTLALAGCQGGDGTGSDGTTTTPTPRPGGGGDATTTTRTPRPRLPTPVAGDPEADVTLAVYEDYACPHCANYNAEGYPNLRAAYVEPGQIRYEHHDLPIPVADPGSWEAANAARAVQDRQGDATFYDYAAGLFANSADIPSRGLELYADLATELELDGDAIRTAAENRAYRRTIRSDRQAGIEDGVSSTPTFQVNGEIVAEGWGGDTLSTVESALDRRLGTTA